MNERIRNLIAARDGAFRSCDTLTLQLQALCEALDRIAVRHPEVRPEIEDAISMMEAVGEQRNYGKT